MADEIFSDKISLAKILTIKYFDLSQQYNQLISEVRLGVVFEEDLASYQPYHFVWQNIFELFNALDYDFGEKLKKEERERIVELRNKFDNLEPLTFLEIKEAFYIVQKLIGISKFLSIGRDVDILDLEDEI